MSVVLGISNSHNGSVALIEDGIIRSAIQAERLSRVKRQWLFQSNQKELHRECIQYCLTSSGVSYADVNAFALTTPWSARKVSDGWLFDTMGGIPDNYFGTFCVPHHFAHMEYIICFGELRPGIVIVIDGSGSFEQDRGLFDIHEKKHPKVIQKIFPSGKEVISAYRFDGKSSQLIYRYSPSLSQNETSNHFSNGLLQSIGHYWRWVSQYCCGSANEAGKVMGLAAFGIQPSVNEPNILSLDSEGFIRVDYHGLATQFTNPNICNEDLTNNSHYENLAARVQYETENVILRLVALLKKKFPEDVLYLTGGVALNVVANEKILGSGLFDRVIMNGSVEDNGTAIGAATAVSYELTGVRKAHKVTDFFGRVYTDEECLEVAAKSQLAHIVLDNDEILKRCAKLLAKGNVIAWFQGKSEFGPRALGNRSILANPKEKNTKYLLDAFMKRRDRYRPYAPVVIEEEASNFFHITGNSPVMMRNIKVRSKSLPAITHVDGSARVQTVSYEDNPKLYSLLVKVKHYIGVPILLNTSFNLPGEPIVETPSDAISTFSRSAIDYLCIGNILISRNEQ